MEEKSLDHLCVDVIRGLAIDAVQKANSGHPGLPLGAAPMAFALWDRHLKHHPQHPEWFNRDRFVLSAGHGSMLLYALLHLTGYDLPLKELKQFRQWESKTPGHPENILTPGVEMATGPLGQGFATAVGMAIAERFLSATFNKPEFPIVDHYTYVICSDGDLMEGVTQEAASLAGHLKLGKLIVLYDDNQISIDGSTEQTFTDNTEQKFLALGWQVIKVYGHLIGSVDTALKQAKEHPDAPTLIMCKTTIGYGSPNKAGTAKAHGAPLGPEEVILTKKALGLPEDKEFWIPQEALDHFRKSIARGEEQKNTWDKLLQNYKNKYPEEGALLESLVKGDFGDKWIHALPNFQESLATRNASQKVLNSIAPYLPTLIGGSADLAESVLTHLKDYGQFQSSTPTGRNIAFGVREHAMMTCVNGITLHGACKAYGGTFLIFSDYCRPALRLAALMECPSIFLFSHDSIGLGEDGPTHQPIEQTMSLRLIPNFNLLRPADGNETSACWKIALESKKTPCAILLSRQSLPIVTPTNIKEHPANKGGYILSEASNNKPKIILVATGSEVHICIDAKKQLEAEAIPTRVVSMPSWFVFENQSNTYKQNVLPQDVLKISVEAGTTIGWAKYTDTQIGIDHFGASAPGGIVLKQFGFSAESIVNITKRALSKNE